MGVFITEMKENDVVWATGCITQEKFLFHSASLSEFETLLGYGARRFSQGVAVGVLLHLPAKHQFEFGGYNQVATDKIDRKTFMNWTDNPDKVKEKVIKEVFTLTGTDRLVKVFPFIRHSEGQDYPPGQGIPQWIVTEKLPFRIVKVLKNYPADRYSRVLN